MKKSVTKPLPEPTPVTMCLRQIDATTQLMSDDPYFQPVIAPKSVPLPKGYVRVDDSTVVQGSLGPTSDEIGPGVKAPKKGG